MTEKASGKFAWAPTPEMIANSRLTAYMQAHGLRDYEMLLQKSDEDPAWYWDSVIKYCDIRYFKPYEKVLDLSGGKPWARWCVGGTTNVVLNCLDKYVGTPTMQQEAVVWEGEDGTIRRWDYAALYAEVNRIAAGLRSLGLGKGDAVGLYLPMLPESIAALLAVAKIGAIILPLFSGFAPNAVAVRMNDGGAKALITADGTLRRGQLVNMKAVVDEAAQDIPTLQHVIVIRNRELPVTWQAGRDHWFHELAPGHQGDEPTEPMLDDEPLMVAFTSGTTGRAKGTVHSHWGMPTKVAFDFGVMMEFSPGDRLLWISDMGWIVGPLLGIMTTMLGGTIVLAEGGPDYPEQGRIWRLVQDHRVNMLGIAPTVVRTLMRYGADKITPYDLSSLKLAVSTGEPWNPDSWNWFFEHVCKRKVPIINISGGTETVSAVLTNTLIHPMKPCSFATATPACGADIVDAQGHSVGPGQVGELVFRTPFISLTRGLWNDRERYLDTYWSKIPDMWVHGDWAQRDEDGLLYILGRSDDAFNVAGKRTGPAEVEALLMETGRVAEAAVVGVPDEIKGEAVVCVCVPAAGVIPGAELDALLSKAVMDGMGKPYKPREIIYVRDLPKTRSMKIMRRVVKAVYTGGNPGDLAGLVNPEALPEIAKAMQAAKGKAGRA